MKGVKRLKMGSSQEREGRETARRRLPRVEDRRSSTRLLETAAAVQEVPRDEPTTEVEDHPNLKSAGEVVMTPTHSPDDSEEDLSPEGTNRPAEPSGEVSRTRNESETPFRGRYRLEDGKEIPYSSWSGLKDEIILQTKDQAGRTTGRTSKELVRAYDALKTLGMLPELGPSRCGDSGSPVGPVVRGSTPSRVLQDDFVIRRASQPHDEVRPPFVLTNAGLKIPRSFAQMSSALQQEPWSINRELRNTQLVDDELRGGYLADWFLINQVTPYDPNLGWQHLSNELFLSLLLQGFQRVSLMPTSIHNVNVVEAAISFVSTFESTMVTAADVNISLEFISGLRAIAQSQAVSTQLWWDAMERLCASIGADSQQREQNRDRFYASFRQRVISAWREESKTPAESTQREPIEWFIRSVTSLISRIRQAKAECLTFGFFVDWHDLIHKDQRAVQQRIISERVEALKRGNAGHSSEAPPQKKAKQLRCQGCGQPGHLRRDCWYTQHPNFNRRNCDFADTPVAKVLKTERRGASQLSLREWWDGKAWHPTEATFQEDFGRRRGDRKPGKDRISGVSAILAHPPLHLVSCCVIATTPPHSWLTTSCLMDSGALQGNFCDAEVAKAVGGREDTTTTKAVRLADGSVVNTTGELVASVVICNEITRSLYTCESLKFHILPQLSTPIILGLPTIRQHQLTQIMPSFFCDTDSVMGSHDQDRTCTRQRGAHSDASIDASDPQFRHMIDADREVHSHVLPGGSSEQTPGVSTVHTPSIISEQGGLPYENGFIGKPMEDVFIPYEERTKMTSDTPIPGVNEPLINRIRIVGSKSRCQKIRALCLEFADVFSDTVRATPATVPPMKLIVDQAKWRTGKNRGAPRFLTPAKESDLQRQITKLIEYKILEPSKATEYSQVHMVPKPDGSMRFCIDYVKLNHATTASEGWPLQNISIMLQRIGSRTPRIFGKMDLTSGYHQAPLDIDSREFSAFITSRGLFQWNRVPMGLKGAPSYFQRVMATTVLVGLVYSICEVYLDDILVLGNSDEEFLSNLTALFVRFRQHGITLNPAKCEFGGEEVEFVGHTISARGMSFSQMKRSKVLDFPRPTTKKQLKGFIGLVNYFRDHVRNLSTLLAPFQELTNHYNPKDVVQWSENLQRAYEEIQQRVAACPALYFVDNAAPIFVQTDASDYGIGAYIFQRKEGREYPIIFVSKSLTKAQLNWSTIEKEAFAIYYTLKKYEHMLRDVKFVLQTDHKNLTYVATAQSPKVRRWCLEIQAYDFHIEHIAGESNVVADNFSRLCRNEADNSCLPSAEEKLQLNALVNELVVPLDRRDLIERVHNSVVGHFGKERTIKLLLKQGHRWKSMRQHVSSFINTCPVCQLRDPMRLQIETHKFTAGAYRPMEVINIDTIGPLQKDSSDCQYILVIIDCFTRFVELYALPDTAALPCARALLNHVGRYGAPMYIRSDRGTQFVNGVIAEFIELIGSEAQLAMAYSKQDNSIVERANKEVMRHLRAILFDKRMTTLWSMDYLPLVQRIINAQPHESIGITPSELLFGKAINLNRGMLSPFIPEEERQEQSERLSDYYINMLEAQKLLISAAQEQQLVEDSYKLSKNTEEQPTFILGSYVTYSPPAGGRHKLQLQRAGPYKVTRISGNEYTIQDLVNHKTITTHISNLKTFKHLPDRQDVRKIAVQNAGQFEIERIVAHRGSRKKRSEMEFKVKWAGYPEDKYDTWEPFQNVRITQAFLDYCNNHRLKSIISPNLIGKEN